MDSTGYLIESGIAITIMILPWCFFMGATYPLAMAYLRPAEGESASTFSYLYLANVIGAAAGALGLSLFLVETLGFSKTSLLASCMNFFLAAAATTLAITRRLPYDLTTRPVTHPRNTTMSSSGESKGFSFPVLFLTGFTSMAMEVVWTRQFTPIIGTTVYAFALLLVTYLVGTAHGSFRYRNALAAGRVKSFQGITCFLAVTAYLPLLLNDPRVHPNMVLLIVSLFPFSVGLGYLLPLLIDKYSRSLPNRAGLAYAVNIAGCILGPLFAGYILLPTLGVKWSLVLLSLPYTFLFLCSGALRVSRNAKRWFALVLPMGTLIVAPFVLTYEEGSALEGRIIRRDYAATVTSGGKGRQKVLLVNGVGITGLTPSTKMMAHLPLAVLETKPESALIICFGMGTTYRSALSWPIQATAVELVPSVKRAFGFYFSDAAALLDSPRGKVVIDDGRRFLSRTNDQFDVITIDPPPPVESAGSSLLYSEEFYALARTHLKPEGTLQQWCPGGEDKILGAVTRAIRRSFPHVRVFHSLEGWGFHFLASNTPIVIASPEVIAGRMPASAKEDLLEWMPDMTVEQVLEECIKKEVSLKHLVDYSDGTTLTDDRPINEYFLLRRLTSSLGGTLRFVH
jgi:spermidine synthase